MMFMNQWDIERAVSHHAHHPVLGPATRFLQDFASEVNAHSDGWAYWAAPVKAARHLMTLIGEPDKATPERFQRALSSIRAFYTRHGIAAGMEFPAIAGQEAADARWKRERPAPRMAKRPPAMERRRKVQLVLTLEAEICDPTWTQKQLTENAIGFLEFLIARAEENGQQPAPYKLNTGSDGATLYTLDDFILDLKEGKINGAGC